MPVAPEPVPTPPAPAPAPAPRTQGHDSSWSPPPSSPSLTAPPPRVGAGAGAGAGAAEITAEEEEAAGDAAAGEVEWGTTVSPSSPGSRRQPSATTRRDPRRAELFRRLAASSFAARRLELPPSPPPPPPPEAEDPDQPFWPPRTAAGRLYMYLRANSMESSPANPALNPNENSISLPPSKKSRKMLPDKDGDQCDDNQHSSESASHQIVLYKNVRSDRGQDEQGGNHFSPAPSNTSKGGLTIGAFTVQCANCFKWRLIPTQEKYEEIRERIQKEPFVCDRAREWKPDVTCDDPTDISQDDSRIWAIDKPSIAQAPRGWQRSIIIRREKSTRFADVYYTSPSGKKLRSAVEIEKYLAENPEHAAGVEKTKFSFKIPAPLQQDYVKKRPQLKPSDVAHTGSTKPSQPEDVLPISWAPPTHEDLADHRLVLHNEDQRELLQGKPPQEKNKGSPQPGAV